MSPTSTTADLHPTKPTMNLNQLTDAQLITQIDTLGAAILDTSQDEQPAFERLCAAFDAVQSELASRGLW